MAGDPALRAASAKPRRRGAALEEAIRGRRGAHRVRYAGLTMDKVAGRAGTNKNAIYRRWPNRAALGLAAYRRLAVPDTGLPDTGTLRATCWSCCAAPTAPCRSPTGDILRGLLAGAADDPELLDDAARAERRRRQRPVADRAVARGEARPEALHPRVATVAVVLLRNEYVTCGVPTVPDDVLVEIVDEVYLPLVRGACCRQRRAVEPEPVPPPKRWPSSAER